MSCSEAGLERLARAVEFERLASALDEGRILLANGYKDEAYAHLRDVVETCPESVLLDWFKASIVEIVSNEVEAVLAD